MTEKIVLYIGLHPQNRDVTIPIPYWGIGIGIGIGIGTGISISITLRKHYLEKLLIFHKV